MKKFLFILSLTLCLCTANKAVAQDFSAVNDDGKTIYYNIVDETTDVEVSYLNYPQNFGNAASYTGEINIPPTVTYEGVTYTVKRIGKWAFANSSANSITMPNTVTDIAQEAFKNSTYLNTIIFSEGLLTIEHNAFFGCTSLTSIELPNSIRTIGTSVFNGCTNLNTISLPDGLQIIGGYAFAGCNALNSLTLPNSITSIGGNAFKNCTNLHTIILTEGWRTIWASAFFSCTSLTTVILPNTVETIGSKAFEGCTNLHTINLPEGLETIENRAFYNCTALPSITLPHSLSTIGDDAFANCLSLNQVTFPNNLQTVWANAFKNCTGLTSIVLPNTVEYIGYSAFYGCSNLHTIVLPNGLRDIGDYSFRKCNALVQIILPNTLQNIGSYAFHNCANLISAPLPDGLITIGSTAFANTKISSVDIPNSVVSIGASAFEGCSLLRRVSIGNSVGSIGVRAFYSCPLLEDVTSYRLAPPVFGTDVYGSLCFGGMASGVVLNVPWCAVSSYQAAPKWVVCFPTINPLPNGPTIINESVCQGSDYTDYGFNLINVQGGGTYSREINPENSCNSTIILNLTVNPAYNVVIDDDITRGYDYTENGFEVLNAQESGVYVQHLQSIKGCDSTVTLNLRVVDWGTGVYTSHTGEVEKDNIDNWEYVPSDETEWIISAGSKVRFTETVEGQKITVKAGGELVAEVDLPNVTIEKPITGGQWNFMGFPIKETTGVSSMIDPSLTGNIWALCFNYYLNTWDDQFLHWTEYDQSLVAQGNGIFVQPAQNNTLNICGTAPNRNVNVIVNNPVSGNDTDGRWMAVANPFTEKLDIATFIRNTPQIQGDLINLYDGTTFQQKENGEIAVGEGFFVNMREGYRTVTISTSSATTSKAQSQEADYLTLSVSTEGYKVPVRFRVNSEASEAYDRFDANKLFGSGTVAEPYLRSNGINLCKEEVSSLPYTATMNVRSGEARTVEIIAERIPEGYDLILVDTEEEIPMQEGDIYTTELVVGDNQDRFSLRIGANASSIQDFVAQEELHITANNRHITIFGAMNTTTEVYNALGQRVFETNEREFALQGVEAGVYVVKSRSGELSQTLKIIIQ